MLIVIVDSEWQQTVDTVSVTAIVGRKLSQDEFTVDVDGQDCCIQIEGICLTVLLESPTMCLYFG